MTMDQSDFTIEAYGIVTPPDDEETDEPDEEEGDD